MESSCAVVAGFVLGLRNNVLGIAVGWRSLDSDARFAWQDWVHGEFRLARPPQSHFDDCWSLSVVRHNLVGGIQLLKVL